MTDFIPPTPQNAVQQKFPPTPNQQSTLALAPPQPPNSTAGRPTDPGNPQSARPTAASNATRLMCAGVYLQASFRQDVIKVLLKQAYRTVAPSYGYDAVAVLGHALAARRLKRKQVLTIIVGVLALQILVGMGVIRFSVDIVGSVWLLWAVPLLRRVSTLELLATTLRRGDAGHPGFDGSHPPNKALNPGLAAKIATQQQGTVEGNVVVYGGYTPFIGAGTSLRDWSFPTVLVGAPVNPLARHADRSLRDTPADGGAVTEEEREPAIPFTVDEITGYVQTRLTAELRDDPELRQRLPLTVDRRHYLKALPAPVKRRRWRKSLLYTEAEQVTARRALGTANGSGEDRERYHSAREYLSIRIRSWDGELVTTIFADFDVRGGTLYSEFYSYVLPPIVSGFHLVDQMPDGFRPRLLGRVGWDLVGGLPRALIGRAGWTAKRLIRLAWRWLKGASRPKRDGGWTDMGLARYTLDLVDTGALVSLRELAASDEYHHFFQEADTTKYMMIVERRLFEAVHGFLREHHIDTADFDDRQTNILNSYGDAVHYGEGNLVQGGQGHRITHQTTQKRGTGN
jgi:hypothetical protein